MGIWDVFKRRRRTGELRTFSLTIAGHGVEAVPELPAAVAHLDDGSLVFGPLDRRDAQRRSDTQGDTKIDARNVLIKPGTSPRGPIEKRSIAEGGLVTYSTGERGTTQLILATGMKSYDGVLGSYRAADRPPYWSIITPDHEIRWPSALTLRATGDLASWPYELALDGNGQKLMALQGPVTGSAQVPLPEQLVADGQLLTGKGSHSGTAGKVSWIEVSYDEAGAGWLQRYYYIPIDFDSVYLLAAQAPEADALRLFAAADQVAMTFKSRVQA